MPLQHPIPVTISASLDAHAIAATHPFALNRASTIRSPSILSANLNRSPQAGFSTSTHTVAFSNCPGKSRMFKMIQNLFGIHRHRLYPLQHIRTVLGVPFQAFYRCGGMLAFPASPFQSPMKQPAPRGHGDADPERSEGEAESISVFSLRRCRTRPRFLVCRRS